MPPPRSLKRSTRVLAQGKQDATPATESPLSILKVCSLVLVAVIVQTTIAPYLTVLGARPDAALVVVVSLALLLGPVWGAFIGFAMGLLIDIALMQTMGISSFLFTLAGYFGGRLADRVDASSWMWPLTAVFVATLVVQTANALIMFLLGVEASAWFVMLRVVLPAALLNALLASPVFAICRWWLKIDQRQNVFTV